MNSAPSLTRRFRAALGLAFALATASLLSSSLVRAAEVPVVTTAAATTLDGTLRPWAYLAVHGSQPGLLDGRRLEVFVKDAAPDAPGVFLPRGRLAPTADVAAIAVLLQRAQRIGDDLASLEAALAELHRMQINRDRPPAVPPLPAPPPLAAPALPLAERLAALQQRAVSDHALGAMLDMLGAGHPAARFVRGTAWAGPLDVPVGAEVTLELRELDAAGVTLAVIGRAGLRAGQPEVLPAPGPLAVVPDRTGGGDLNHALRWALPPELRRKFFPGTLVWRVNDAFAEARNFHLTPPDAAELAALAQSHPAEVKRLTPGPVAATKFFDAASVANFQPDPVGDPKTAFLIDDNDRGTAAGGEAPEGRRVYYFAAAADLLGRPGLVSPGVEARFHRRIPPALPRRFDVEIAWTETLGQHFAVRWEQNPPAPGPATTHYEIYRGRSLVFHAQANDDALDLDLPEIVAGDPDAIRRVGTVADPGDGAAALLRFADTSVPATDANFGRTWWFAIRAVHQGPAGTEPVASALSPPVFCALRQHRGPDAPTGFVLPNCLRVHCTTAHEAREIDAPAPVDPTVLTFVVQCRRVNRGISAAQFRAFDRSSGAEIFPWTSVEFAPGEDVAAWTFTRLKSTRNSVVVVQCRAVAFEGSLSRPVEIEQFGTVAAGRAACFPFQAGAITETERQEGNLDDFWSGLPPPNADECRGDRLVTVSPATGAILHPLVLVAFTPGSVEYRLYRRIDDGPLTLLHQGPRTPAGATSFPVRDTAPATACGTVTYFEQLIDEHGNTSPMASLGTFVVPGPPPPVPFVSQPTPADFLGDFADATVALTWSCASAGVARFEVFVTTVATDPAPGASAPGSATLKSKPVSAVFKTWAETAASSIVAPPQSQSFLTGRVGGEFGAGPKFTLPLRVQPGVKYRVWLRGLGACGEVGEQSRHVEFAWQPPPPPAAGVPWPARPLPAVGSFHPGIVAQDFASLPEVSLRWGANLERIDTNVAVVGVRVGSLPSDGGEGHSFAGEPPEQVMTLSAASPGFGRGDPNAHLYRHAGDGTTSLLPAVLYRQQVANDLYPEVSGAVVQCSPMVRDVAWQQFGGADQTYFFLRDPYFRWTRADPTRPNSTIDLHLIDTQPVVAGARYRYWLVRFSRLGEPEQTIPCGEVTIRE